MMRASLASPTRLLQKQLLRHPVLRRQQQLQQQQPRRRYAAHNGGPHTGPQTARLDRFNRRMPKFLHKYTNALATAPLSHITSFLVLHEITAIVPLLGLAATFHYTHWLPSWFAEGAWVLSGVEMFGRYFRRKGWIRNEEAAEAESEARLELRRRDQAWNVSEGGVRLVVEFATAYAVTKALLPLRVVLSVWATPWFATRTVLPVMGFVKRAFGRGKTKKAKGE